MRLQGSRRVAQRISTVVGYNAPVACLLIAALLLFASVEAGYAQEATQPPVRVNILNVCAPGESERAALAAALSEIPKSPRFGADFEVARGRSTMESSTAHWVRLRREFHPEAAFNNAQYSFSVDQGAITETLVVRPRDPVEILQVSIEDSVTAAEPAAVLASDTPASRVKVERLGKGFLILTRCPQVDQAAYDSLFRQASSLMTLYRKALAVRSIVSAELARLPIPAARPGAEKKPADAKP
jgi:hypothetical protein